jgi:hypothetical protein
MKEQLVLLGDGLHARGIKLEILIGISGGLVARSASARQASRTLSGAALLGSGRSGAGSRGAATKVY